MRRERERWVVARAQKDVMVPALSKINDWRGKYKARGVSSLV